MGGQRPLAPPLASSGTSSPGEAGRPRRRCLCPIAPAALGSAEQSRTAAPPFREGPGASGTPAARSFRHLPAPRLFGRRERLPGQIRPHCRAVAAPAARGRRAASAPPQRRERDQRPAARGLGGAEESVQATPIPRGRKAGSPGRCQVGPWGETVGKRCLSSSPPFGGGSPSESGGCVPSGVGLGGSRATPPPPPSRRPFYSQPASAVGMLGAKPRIAPMEESWPKGPWRKFSGAGEQLPSWGSSREETHNT